MALLSLSVLLRRGAGASAVGMLAPYLRAERERRRGESCNKLPWAAAAATAAALLSAVSSAHSRPSVSAEAAGKPSFLQAQKKERASSQVLTRRSIADAAEKAAPSVVNINSEVRQGMFMSALSSGSGFILSADGVIATNAHVVSGATRSEVMVTLHSGERLPGKVHALDGQTDIAIVKVNPSKPLTPAVIGCSSSLRPGDWVIALGSPHRLSNSVSAGIVSARARPGSELGMAKRTEYLQTDAAVNPGNSGGPLVDLDGAVVAINTLKLATSDGISFSIPIDVAMLVIPQLLEHGRVARPYIGISMLSVERARFDPDYRPQGAQGGGTLGQGQRGSWQHKVGSHDMAVLVSLVEQGSPADQAGLRESDLIVAIDGFPVVDGGDVINRIGLQVGRQLDVKVKRAGRAGYLTFKLRSEAYQHKR